MISLINRTNCNKIPTAFFLLLVFSYLLPNLRYPSVGENSFLTVLIVIFSYSLLTYREIKIYLIIGILCLFSPLYSGLFFTEFEYFSIISSLMSLYIITVPVISSITLGRIIGYRYSNKSNQIIRKDFYSFISLLFLLFPLSAFLKRVAPKVLYFFLHAGRTSHGRYAFFFTEPSQSSIILIGLLFLGICFFFKNRFSMIFPKRKLIGFVITSYAILLVYLAQPLTAFAQLLLLILISFSILTSHFIYQIVVNKTIKLRIFGLKKSFLFLSQVFIILSIISYFVYYATTNYFIRILGLLNFIDKRGLFEGITISAGNRFQYVVVSLIEGIRKPLSIPGDWVGQFYGSLVNVLSEYNMPPDYYSLELYKQSVNPLVLKPSGWLYFGIYDLGIIGLLIVSIFLFKRYLSWSIKGIIECDKFIILLVSAQLSFLLMPLLPSTPYVFLPILLASIRFSYQEKRVIN